MCVKVSFIPAAAADAGVGAPAALRSKLGESSMTETASLRFSSSIRDAGGQGSIPAVHPLMVSNIEMDTETSQVWLGSCDHTCTCALKLMTALERTLHGTRC